MLRVWSQAQVASIPRSGSYVAAGCEAVPGGLGAQSGAYLMPKRSGIADVISCARMLREA